MANNSTSLRLNLLTDVSGLVSGLRQASAVMDGFVAQTGRSMQAFVGRADALSGGIGKSLAAAQTRLQTATDAQQAASARLTQAQTKQQQLQAKANQAMARLRGTPVDDTALIAKNSKLAQQAQDRLAAATANVQAKQTALTTANNRVSRARAAVALATANEEVKAETSVFTAAKKTADQIAKVLDAYKRSGTVNSNKVFADNVQAKLQQAVRASQPTGDPTKDMERELTRRALLNAQQRIKIAKQEVEAKERLYSDALRRSAAASRAVNRPGGATATNLERQQQTKLLTEGADAGLKKAQLLLGQESERAAKLYVRAMNMVKAKNQEVGPSFDVMVARAERAIMHFLNSINRLSNGVRQGFQGISEIFRTLSMSVAAPLGYLMIDMGRSAIDFEQAWAKAMKAIKPLGTITNEMDILQQKIRELAKITPTSAEQLARWAEQGGQIGIEGGPAILRYVNLVNKAAIGTDVNADAIAEDIGRISAAFGKDLSTEQGMQWAERIVSVFDLVAKTTSTNMQGIITAMKDAATVGPLLNIPAQEVAASVGILINAGLEASGAGNALQRFFVQATKDAKGFSAMMKNYTRVVVDEQGKVTESFENLYETEEKVKKAFSEAPTLVLLDVLRALRDTPKDMNVEMLNQFADVVGLYSIRVGAAGKSSEYLNQMLGWVNAEMETGATLQMDYMRMLDTTDAQLKVTQNNFKDLGMTIAAEVLPVFNQLLQLAIPAIKMVADWFGKLDQKTKMLVVGIPLLVVVLTPVVFIISSLLHGIALLGTALISVAMGLVGLSFSAIKLFTSFSKLGTSITAIGKLLGFGAEAVTGFAATTTSALGIILTPIKWLLIALSALAGAFLGLNAMGVDIAGFFTTIADNARKWGESMMGRYANGLAKGASLIARVLSGIAKMIASFFGGGNKKVNVSVGTNTQVTKLPGRAKGGPVKRGDSYVVGENGPEVFSPEQSGTIIPNGGNLVRGISGSVSAVTQAANQIADAVASVLGPNASTGPFSTIAEWGQNIMRKYLEGFGIEDFDILSDVSGKIRSILDIMESFKEINTDGVFNGILQAKQWISEVIDVFNRTGQVAENVLSNIGQNMGALGKDVQLLTRYWLSYVKIQKTIKELEGQRKNTLRTYDAEIARIAKLNISAEEKAELMRQQMALRDEELRRIEQEKTKQEDAAEVAKTQLDWQQAFIDAQLETIGLYKEMKDAKEKAAEENGGADSIQFDTPTYPVPDAGDPIEEWVNQVNSFTDKFEKAQKAWQLFLDGFNGKEVNVANLGDDVIDLYGAGKKLGDIWRSFKDGYETVSGIFTSAQTGFASISDAAKSIISPETTAYLQGLFDTVMLSFQDLSPALTMVMDAINAVITTVQGFWAQFTNNSGLTFIDYLLMGIGTLLTAIIGLGALIFEFVANTVAFVANLMAGTQAGITSIFTGLGSMITGIMNIIWGILTLFTGNFSNATARIIAGFIQLTLGFINLATGIFGWLASAAGAIVGFIVVTISNIFQYLLTNLAKLVGLSDEKVKQIADFFTNLNTKVMEFITGIPTAFANAFKDIIEKTKKFVNDLLASLGATGLTILGIGGENKSTSGSNKAGSGSPKNNAHGGVAMGPHIGRFGEAGPEALIPLDKLPSMFSAMYEGEFYEGTGGGMVVNVNNPVVREEQDIQRIADAVSRKISAKTRNNMRLGLA